MQLLARPDVASAADAVERDARRDGRWRPIAARLPAFRSVRLATGCSREAGISPSSCLSTVSTKSDATLPPLPRDRPHGKAPEVYSTRAGAHNSPQEAQRK